MTKQWHKIQTLKSPNPKKKNKKITRKSHKIFLCFFFFKKENMIIKSALNMQQKRFMFSHLEFYLRVFGQHLMTLVFQMCNHLKEVLEGFWFFLCCCFSLRCFSLPWRFECSSSTCECLENKSRDNCKKICIL